MICKKVGALNQVFGTERSVVESNVYDQYSILFYLYPYIPFKGPLDSTIFKSINHEQCRKYKSYNIDIKRHQLHAATIATETTFIVYFKISIWIAVPGTQRNLPKHPPGPFRKG
jgi:hypothetical protein